MNSLLSLCASVPLWFKENANLGCCAYAPNLSNIFALACMSRIKNFASNTPSEPVLAPVSVNRSSLSEPEYAERSNTGCGCHEWPLMTHGVE